MGFMLANGACILIFGLAGKNRTHVLCTSRRSTKLLYIYIYPFSPWFNRSVFSSTVQTLAVYEALQRICTPIKSAPCYVRTWYSTYTLWRVPVETAHVEEAFVASRQKYTHLLLPCLWHTNEPPSTVIDLAYNTVITYHVRTSQIAVTQDLIYPLDPFCFCVLA